MTEDGIAQEGTEEGNSEEVGSEEIGADDAGSDKTAPEPKAVPAKGRPAKADPAGSASKPLPPSAKKKLAAKSTPEGASRYTAPSPTHRRGPSPRWVPVLMFALWGIGLLLIILNYMGVLPGSADGGNGWYLVGGLGSILAGIIVATQYR